MPFGRGSSGAAWFRKSQIKSVEPKTGSTGSMVFVTVQHTISGPRGVSFVEDTPLWDNIWFYMLLLLLLTAEWVIRKRTGLP